MWQLFALGSIVAYAFEEVIDKIAIVDTRTVDSMIATFWRQTFFGLAIVAIALTGWAGSLQTIFSPLLVPLAVIAALSAISYTYVLRHIEVTGIGALGYVAPFVFLIIDMQVLQQGFSWAEITGITLLILGGLGFVVDGKTHHMKKEFSLLVWGALVSQMVYAGCEAYLFKHLHATYGMNGVTFLVYLVVMVSVMMLVVVVVQGKASLLFARMARRYAPFVMLSKGCDAAGAVLWAQALTLAAVSQVSAIESLQPLALFAVAFVAQRIFGFHVRERLAPDRVRLKLLSVAFLVLGGFLVG